MWSPEGESQCAEEVDFARLKVPGLKIPDVQRFLTAAALICVAFRFNRVLEGFAKSEMLSKPEINEPVHLEQFTFSCDTFRSWEPAIVDQTASIAPRKSVTRSKPHHVFSQRKIPHVPHNLCERM